MNTENYNQKASRGASHESSHGASHDVSHGASHAASHQSSIPAFAWTAPLRRKMQKGKTWMTGASAIALFLLFYAAATRNWIFVVAIITAVVVYALDHYEREKKIDIEISEFGLRIGDNSIPFSDIKSFWIIYNPPFVKKLCIRLTSHVMPDIGIDLDSQDPVEIRKFMKRHSAEVEGKKESLMDLSTRLLKL